MADAKHGIESMKERKDHEIVREAFEGEDKGVTAVEKLSQGKLDDESMKLIHSLMDTEHQHIKTLENLSRKKSCSKNTKGLLLRQPLILCFDVIRCWR
jgi:hypothetical protein